jgi:hypothetical protein
MSQQQPERREAQPEPKDSANSAPATERGHEELDEQFRRALELDQRHDPPQALSLAA